MTLEIIAELAQGYEGRPEQANLLLKAAAMAGADAAKYQLVYADELATPDYKYYNLFRSLEMPDTVWSDLAGYASELGIRLQLDIFGIRSLSLADSLGVSAVKLHGTDVANIGLLNAVAESSVETVLLGAGGGYALELDRAVEALGGKKVTILLGFQGYPTLNECNQIDRVRLLVEKYRQISRVKIGFADHASPGSPLRYALSAVAIGAGARVLEKHLTLGKVMKLEDHESALNPDEFFEFTQIARDCADAFGQAASEPDFCMTESEQAYRRQIRRHVVTRHDIRRGERLQPDDLVLKRSSCAEALTDLSLAYDATLRSSLASNSPVTRSDIE